MVHIMVYFFSLVDLGEDNITKLKLADEIEAERQASGGKETVEAAEAATIMMAEKAGEKPTKVSVNINLKN